MGPHGTDVLDMPDDAACSPSDIGVPVKFRHLVPAVATAVALAVTPATAHADTNVQAFSTAVPTWTLAQLYDFRQLSGFVEQTAGWSMSDWYDFQVFVAGQVVFREQADLHRADWERTARCEEPNEPWSFQGSVYGGRLGITDGAWRQFGGLRYASRPGYATEDEQIITANAIADGTGFDVQKHDLGGVCSSW